MDRILWMAAMVIALALPAAPAFSEEVRKTTVGKGQTVLLGKMYSVGMICGRSAVSGRVSGKVQFGTVRFERKKEVLPEGQRVGGDGHSYCFKETGVNLHYYTAGQSPGRDDFYLVFAYGTGEPRRYKYSVEVK